MLLILVSIEIHWESWFFSLSASNDGVGCIEHKFIYTDCYTHVKENFALNAEHNNQPELACDYKTQNQMEWEKSAEWSVYTQKRQLFSSDAVSLCDSWVHRREMNQKQSMRKMRSFSFYFAFAHTAPCAHSNNVWTLVKWSRDDDRIPFFLRKTETTKTHLQTASIQRVYSE